MVLTKRKPSAEEREATLLTEKRDREATLLAEVLAMRAKIQDYIEEKAQELKRSQDGRNLPIQMLRQQLHRYECECRCAARLLGDPNA